MAMKSSHAILRQVWRNTEIRNSKCIAYSSYDNQSVQSVQSFQPSPELGHSGTSLYPGRQTFKDNSSLAEYLVNNIVYKFHVSDLIAVNKPVGVPMRVDYRQGFGKKKADKIVSMENCLSHLREHFKCDQLCYVDSLGKFASGVVVLSKTEELAKRLQRHHFRLMKHGFCFQHFTLICRGVPVVPEKGSELIFITHDHKSRMEDLIAPKKLEEGTAENPKQKQKYFSVSQESPEVGREEYSKQGKSYVRAKVIIDTVKSSKYNDQDTFSLVNLKTNNGKFHSPRMYMASKLCPILGDNVFFNCPAESDQVINSEEQHENEERFQALQESVRKDLGIVESDIPFHLHRSGFMIVKRGTKEKPFERIINAPLPEYFTHTLKTLNLLTDSDVSQETNSGV